MGHQGVEARLVHHACRGTVPLRRQWLRCRPSACGARNAGDAGDAERYRGSTASDATVNAPHAARRPTPSRTRMDYQIRPAAPPAPDEEGCRAQEVDLHRSLDLEELVGPEHLERRLHPVGPLRCARTSSNAPRSRGGAPRREAGGSSDEAAGRPACRRTPRTSDAWRRRSRGAPPRRWPPTPPRAGPASGGRTGSEARVNAASRSRLEPVNRPRDRLERDDLGPPLGEELAEGVVEQEVGPVRGPLGVLGVDVTAGHGQAVHGVGQVARAGHEGIGEGPAQGGRGARGARRGSPPRC